MYQVLVAPLVGDLPTDTILRAIKIMPLNDKGREYINDLDRVLPPIDKISQLLSSLGFINTS